MPPLLLGTGPPKFAAVGFRPLPPLHDIPAGRYRLRPESLMQNLVVNSIRGGTYNLKVVEILMALKQSGHRA